MNRLIRERSPVSWQRFDTRFGGMAVAWEAEASGPRVVRIHLPGATTGSDGMSLGAAPPAIAELIEQLQAFLDGEAVVFDLGVLTLERCGDFQRRVLLAEAAIPRGWVSTYGRIAAHVGAPGAARAVGSALARNPFPVVVPCHRALRASGALGGYQGGLAMKRALLSAEGVAFRDEREVLMERVWY